MFERLQGSFEQVARFTSDASHELKTPLALMRAEVETALETPGLAAGPRELLSNLIEQCTQLSQIVDGLLFLSRADDRSLAIERKPVDLVALVHDLAEDAEILAEPSKLELRSELPAELVVSGDRLLLARAVMNLIDNGIKYNEPGGSVILFASVNGKNASLRVRNTGPGLTLEQRERVFDRFYRSDPSHQKETAGHGLGLSIAREIARAHGGDVHLVHSDSSWTEFSIVLPVVSPG
jgi:signal transduction histidine kinase